MSLDHIRDLKTSQVMASNGLKFYESASSGDWDPNQMANAVGGQQQASVVCYYGDSKKDKHSQLI